MESIMREREAPEREPAPSDRTASTTAMLDGRSLTTRPATRTLQGCAREGCLEIAQSGSNYCPLHVSSPLEM
jgi:hypothetical protein